MTTYVFYKSNMYLTVCLLYVNRVLVP